MHTVAAVIDEGALTFDFAIPCEVFGFDRSDLVDPWYEFLVVAAGKRRIRTQTGFVLEAPHGLAAPSGRFGVQRAARPMRRCRGRAGSRRPTDHEPT